MSQLPIKFAVRTLFALSSRERASRSARNLRDRYLALAGELDSETGRRVVEVPASAGVDEDMRRWSFFMLLEHNAIVNRSIAAIVRQLALGEAPHGDALTDPKTGVLPSSGAGPEQIDRFARSVDDYLNELSGLPRLRGTARRDHPVFGKFDAHDWHCMFAFHLKVHLNQAKTIVTRATER